MILSENRFPSRIKPEQAFSGSCSLEDRDRADRRAGAAAPFQRQADEAEPALPEQRLEIAQAFDVRDVELEAGLVHQRVYFAFGARPHRIDAEMHDPLAR